MWNKQLRNFLPGQKKRGVLDPIWKKKKQEICVQFILFIEVLRKNNTWTLTNAKCHLKKNREKNEKCLINI